jgi:uncharacterized protein
MIQNIIEGQKTELEQKLREQYIKRETEIKGLSTDLISVVIGSRRAGKSFFTIHSSGAGTGIGYINFDEERLLRVENFDEIITAVQSVYGNPKTLFFDEIQNVDQWEIIVNRLHREGFKLILTGSNSHLLISDLATHLTGRHLATYLFPFSFSEVLNFSGQSLTEYDKQKLCTEYINKGGFPEIWVKKYDVADYLTALFDSIVLKDIVKRYRVRFPGALIDLAQILITNMTGEFSANSIRKLAHFSSIQTTVKYMGYLEEAFLLFTIPRFSYKMSEQQKTGKKVYCYDNGYYQAKAFKFSSNMGKLFENAVAVELRRREMEGLLRLFYYKNRQNEEIDFVVQQELKINCLIQVCCSVSDSKVKDREIRALLNAGSELNCNRLQVITSDYEKTESHSWFGKSAEIEFIPLYKWLLRVR